MSDFIGVIIGANTGTVYAIINPTFDSELDNPRFLLLRGEKTEAIQMVKIPRSDYMNAMTLEQLSALVEKFKK